MVLGLGPIGDMASRVALNRGVEPGDRRSTWSPSGSSGPARAASRCSTCEEHDDDIGAVVRDLTGGRGPDAVIDAVGMEAHGSPGGQLAQTLTALLPDAVAAKLMQTAGVDRLAALHLAIELVRRGGTISLIGVYGGMADPLPMLQLFDKQLQIRMGQANVALGGRHPAAPAPTTTRSASTTSPPTGCRWRRPRTRTTSSRRSRTAR